MKVASLVARILRLIQVIDPNQSVKDTDMSTTIDALNGMVRRWEANHLALGWQSVSNPSDDVPVPDEALDALAYCCAVRVAPEYGVTPLPAVIQMANNLFGDLLRDQAVATPIQPIYGGPRPRSWSGATLNGSSWFVG